MDATTQQLYDALIEEATYFIAHDDLAKAQELIEAAVVLRKACAQP